MRAGARSIFANQTTLEKTDRGVRSFLKRAYPTMKHHNPSIPILIREATDVEPKVWARYGTNLHWHMTAKVGC